MPRPRKCRRVCGLPQNDRFGPLGCAAAGEPIEMTVDEYETIRMIDLLGCTQEVCAEQMQVARTTVTAVYNSARKKLADALVNGKHLIIRGGDYTICPRAQGCPRRCRKSSGGCQHENCSDL